MNVFHLPDFHLDWIDRGLINPSEIFYNLLTDPYFYSAQTLHESLKPLAQKKWQDYIEKLRTLNAKTETLNQAESILRYIMMPNTDIDAEKNLMKDIERHDRLNQQNFYQTFPELLIK